MREKLKIMQRIKNLTSAYPLSAATRLACTHCAHSGAKLETGCAGGGELCEVRLSRREGGLPVA